MEQVARAAAILLPVGAWDVTPLELACPRMDIVTLFLTYTRGGAAGAVDYYLEYSPYSVDRAGVEDWFKQAAYAVGGVAAGADTASLEQAEVATFTPLTANAEMIPLGPIALDGVIERIRLNAAESGNVGAPGTFYAVAIFNNE